MPQQINVFDRPTYQTEKVKGWDVVRMFKATALTSENNNSFFSVNQGDYIIQSFISTYNSNYKGTNQIDLSKIENFDSIRIKMNGLFRDELGSWFNFFLSVCDTSYNLINSKGSNYDTKLDGLPYYDIYQDWYLDVELTFFIDDIGYYNVVFNGNYSISFNNDNKKRGDVRLIPFCGEMNLGNTPQKIYIDFSPWNGGNNPYFIKSVSMDFVE